MARIALIAMSAKPYHAGHDSLIRLAARESDMVRLFVSLSDRKRSKEALILGSDMARVWKEQIAETLPDNVELVYLAKGASPIGTIWSELGRASQASTADSYVVYGDPEDLAMNFPPELMSKYAHDLYETGQLTTRPVDRSETVDISGTQMRQYLASGDKDSFTSNLPVGMDVDAVWSALSHTAQDPPKGIKTTTGPKRKARRPKVEGLLRSYVRTVLGD